MNFCKCGHVCLIRRCTLVLIHPLLQQIGQAATAVEQLLRALWHSEFQCRYGSYRTGIILLADIGLEFGMTKHCKRILEEIMPQVRSPSMQCRMNLTPRCRSLMATISSSVLWHALLLRAASSQQGSSHRNPYVKPYHISKLLRKTMRRSRYCVHSRMCSSWFPCCTTTWTWSKKETHLQRGTSRPRRP